MTGRFHHPPGPRPAAPRAPGRIHALASRFALPGPIEAFEFPGRGNINQQSYLVLSGARENPDPYLLQMLNPTVFRHPEGVIEAMTLCLQTQRRALARLEAPDLRTWEVLELVPTVEGRPCLVIPAKEGVRCWRMMGYLRNTRCWRSLGEIPDRETRLRVAAEAGRGLALFHLLTADLDPGRLRTPLPGYRDTALYYAQLHSVLAGNRTAGDAAPFLPEDAALAADTAHDFVVHLAPGEFERRRADACVRRLAALADRYRDFALTLCRGLEEGKLKRGAIHGDTKLENFLFDAATGRVRALVDLDTIMPHTWLSDWGDLVRSLVNIAGERETDAEKIRIDPALFRAAARGFLSPALPMAAGEKALMTAAPAIMALELGVRFLADYVRGDRYFRLRPDAPPDLNRSRALVQFRVFEELRRHAGLLEVETGDQDRVW